MAIMTNIDILSSALECRNQEILEYQINIDNFTRAIDKITTNYADNEDLVVFRDELCQRLQQELRQQLRTIILRDVIADQLTEASQ